MRCITHLDTLWSLDLFSYFSSRHSKSRWWWSLLGRYFVIWITSCFLTMKKTTKNAVGTESKQAKKQEPRSAVAASHHKRREEFISSSRGRYLSPDTVVALLMLVLHDDQLILAVFSRNRLFGFYFVIFAVLHMKIAEVEEKRKRMSRHDEVFSWCLCARSRFVPPWSSLLSASLRRAPRRWFWSDLRADRRRILSRRIF